MGCGATRNRGPDIVPARPRRTTSAGTMTAAKSRQRRQGQPLTGKEQKEMLNCGPSEQQQQQQQPQQQQPQQQPQQQQQHRKSSLPRHRSDVADRGARQKRRDKSKSGAGRRK
eukprot:TRINITY_DN7724_c0_g3_i3.p2 TRINITY_DN7724_c0_g3~~TRINITY_DN7724_c0_g3_i3.p2  ORF type:complete len:113 (+),score=32.28 TRINITY_DN7724_c0_g3_i3:93-431(+)